MRLITLDLIVAILGLLLAIIVYFVLNTLGAPTRICLGAAILSALVTGIFWSAVGLGCDDEE